MTNLRITDGIEVSLKRIFRRFIGKNQNRRRGNGSRVRIIRRSLIQGRSAGELCDETGISGFKDLKM
jgi:hypothetical protein